MSGFLGAATLYILVVDQHRYLIQKLNFKKGLSAILIVLIVLIFILIPLTGIAFLVIDTFSSITIDPEVILGQINDFINSLEARLGFNIFTPENLSALPRAGTNILQILGNSIYSFIINVVVILFVLYYMLYSNEEFEKAITEILPFKDENKEILIDETKLIIQANAIGIPLMAILQGLFAYMGYLLFGVNSALLYAILTAFATILPLVGTMIIWVPLGIGLLIGGDLVNGVGLIIYGLFIIGGVDNVARFLLQKKLADIHPLITVFGVLIGIPIFGFWGVIFGPLLLSLFILFFNMYRHEYVPGSKAEARVTTRLKAKKMKIPGYSPAKPKKKQKKNEVQSE
jgi:predicted PurR-regulated permease PerM